MSATETISATEFKAKCLGILDQIKSRQLQRVAIAEHGRVVAVLVPPAEEASQVRQLHGFLRGSVVIPDDVDLTAPALNRSSATG